MKRVIRHLQLNKKDMYSQLPADRLQSSEHACVIDKVWAGLLERAEEINYEVIATNHLKVDLLQKFPMLRPLFVLLMNFPRNTTGVFIVYCC